jgi:hypothetical protein
MQAFLQAILGILAWIFLGMDVSCRMASQDAEDLWGQQQPTV